jgi:hypothetical protein
MNKIISLLFASAFVMFSNIAFGQVIFFEDFESDGIPQNFTLIDNDGNTPAANVSYFTNAWIARNAPGSTDSVAASTSWYTPADTSDDWMITPAIATGTNVILTWNAKAQDAAYRDGYNVLVSRTGITIPDFTDTIFSVAMEDSNWITRSVDLSAKGYDNSTIYIAFQNNSVDMYMLMIDDIKVRNIPSTDIEIGVVTLPGSSCTLTAAESISIEIKNTGLNAVSNIPVGYIVNGGSAVVETFSGTLQPGSDTIYTFTQTADFSTSGSQYDVRAFVAASGDGDVANDSSFSSTVYNVSPSDIDNASYATSFETLNEILGWSTDDVNGDGRGWFLAGTQAYDGINAYLCLYNASLAANDWLYSTCFDLSGNTAYKLNFFYKTGSSASNTYPEKFAVYYGTAKNAASMTQIEDIGEVSNIDYEESTLTFKPAASGTYYIGFKCYSDADMYYLAIDQITVDKLSPPVASFTYTTVNLGVSFNTPNGNDPANTLSWKCGSRKRLGGCSHLCTGRNL